METASSPCKDELDSNQLGLYFNVLRFVTALVREQVPMATVSPPLPPTQPSGSSALFQCEKIQGEASTVQAVPRVPSSTSGTSGTSSGGSFTQQQSGARSNRVVLPQQLTAPLEAFRMAITNLPFDEAAVRESRHALHDAVLQTFPRDDVMINRIFDQDDSEHLGGSSSVRNDFGHRFSSTDDVQTMQEILPGLWCGSYHPATNKATLKRHGITHILCCIGTACRFANEFMYMSIPLSDRPDFNIIPFFNRTFEFIENALIRENGGVLVHCGAGISRAPTVTAAYLMRKLRITSRQAIRMVQAQRPYASPNAGFCQQLRQYGRQLQLVEPLENTEQDAAGRARREGKDAALKALALQKRAEPGSLAAQKVSPTVSAEKT